MKTLPVDRPPLASVMHVEEHDVYLRRVKIRKQGKTHIYWNLVRSVRCGSKVRQETVAYLGELNANERAAASKLSQYFLGDRVNQRELFEEPDVDGPVVSVRSGRVRVERSRTFGDVWLAWTLWKTLELDRFFASVLPKHRERVAWADVITILTIARLCEPSSELHTAESWYGKTALEDILGVRDDLVHHMRLYRGMDQLLRLKEPLEKHLKERLGSLFDLKYDLLLYDVTSTFFEGQAEGVTKAKRGHSRDNRPDCKQVCVALVTTRDGYPVGHEVFAGNRNDATTVEEIVGLMERKHGKMDRVWVWDRGMTSKENLEWMNAGGRRYLVGTPKSELKRFEVELVERRGWKQVRSGLKVKLCEGPGGKETFILCHSEDREKKEAAMHQRFSERIQENLESLERRCAKSKKRLSRGPIERQIGRMLQRNSCAAGKFEIQVRKDDSRPAGIRVSWKERKAWSDWARLSEGAYVLRSNVTDWTPEELWRTYIQLTDVEAAFRTGKIDLNLRPIWHHSDERVEGHILVCFLAYALWKTLEGWQARAGLGNSPRTLLNELRKIPCVDVLLPLTNGNDMRLRCVARPDEDHAMLLDRLGLRLPQRLRAQTLETEM